MVCLRLGIRKRERVGNVKTFKALIPKSLFVIGGLNSSQ